MKFTVIGIADTPQPFFPPEVMRIISQGEVFSGGKRHHEIVAPLLPEGIIWIDITVPIDRVFEQYEALAKDIVVFASGDPLFFGFANTIRRKLPDAEMVLYPTFNSLQSLAHRLVMPYHDMRIVSLTGRPWREFDKALIERAPKIGVLTDREHTPAAIAVRMLDYGYNGYVMHVGEHLGHPTEEPWLVEIGLGRNGLIEVLDREDVVLVIECRAPNHNQTVGIKLGHHALRAK